MKRLNDIEEKELGVLMEQWRKATEEQNTAYCAIQAFMHRHVPFNGEGDE